MLLSPTLSLVLLQWHLSHRSRIDSPRLPEAFKKILLLLSLLHLSKLRGRSVTGLFLLLFHSSLRRDLLHTGRQ